MRGDQLAFVAAVVLGCSLASTGGAAAGTPSTIQKIVRPVTSAGVASPGFAVSSQSGWVFCNLVNPSPGAVDPNIEECDPSAAYAIACWKAAAAERVLCSQDPSKQSVVSIALRGSFAPTAPAVSTHRAPLLLVLDDGTRCQIRDGGAWARLAAHPGWVGTYGCGQNTTAVWSPPNAAHYGVNESTRAWTVEVAPMSGTGPLTTRQVRLAYFVGTSTGAALPFTGLSHTRFATSLGLILVMTGSLIGVAGRRPRTDPLSRGA